MKNLARASILIGTFLFGLPVANADDCYSDGYQLGVSEADSFCGMWERMYNEDAVIMPYRSMSMKLCNYQLVTACKQGMAQHARQNYPLCTHLVRSGWQNSQGQSATSAWAAWQRGACNVVIP